MGGRPGFAFFFTTSSAGVAFLVFSFEGGFRGGRASNSSAGAPGSLVDKAVSLAVGKAGEGWRACVIYPTSGTGCGIVGAITADRGGGIVAWPGCWLGTIFFFFLDMTDYCLADQWGYCTVFWADNLGWWAGLADMTGYSSD